MRLFHLIEPSAWADAVEAGVYTPPSLAAEGFVHFSFVEQVTGTANLRYRDVPELVVLEVETDQVDAELRVEDSYGTGTEFPHLYGPIPASAVVGIHDIERTAGGDWTFQSR